MDNSAIILIDMDIPFLQSYAAIQIKNQIKVLKTFREIPQVVLEYHMDVIEPITGPRTLNSLKTVINGDATYIWKTDNDGFRSTKFHGNIPETVDGFTNISLESHLNFINAKDLIVMGYHRDSCVYATAKSAVNAGFKVHTCMDVLANNSMIISDEEVSHFYEARVKLYGSVDELIEGVST
jgi:hypothetical protein